MVTEKYLKIYCNRCRAHATIEAREAFDDRNKHSGIENMEAYSKQSVKSSPGMIAESI